MELVLHAALFKKDSSRGRPEVYHKSAALQGWRWDARLSQNRTLSNAAVVACYGRIRRAMRIVVELLMRASNINDDKTRRFMNRNDSNNCSGTNRSDRDIRSWHVAEKGEHSMDVAAVCCFLILLASRGTGYSVKSGKWPVCEDVCSWWYYAVAVAVMRLIKHEVAVLLSQPDQDTVSTRSVWLPVVPSQLAILSSDY